MNMNQWIAVLVRTIFLAALAWLPQSSASGAIVHVDYAGVLANTFGPIPSALSGIFNIGDPFTGSFQYDSTLSGTIRQADTTFYNGFASFKTNISGFIFSAFPAWGEVTNNGNAGTVDTFIVHSGSSEGPFNVVTGPTINGLSMKNMDLDFRDNTAIAFNSVSLPAAVINLQMFDQNYITFLFRAPDNTAFPMWGKITSASGSVVDTAVPEPASFAVWGSIGLIGLAAGWRRRGRQSI